MMRAHHIAICSLVLAASVGCNKEPKGNDNLKGEVNALGHAEEGAKDEGLQAKLSAIVPRLGGNLVALGDNWLELAVHKNGLVEGLFFDKQGKLIEKPEAQELAVKLHAKGGAAPEAKLKWVAESARFVGTANAKAETDAKGTAKADAKGTAKADVEGATDVKTGVKADAKTDAKAVADAKADAQTKTDATAFTQLELVPEPIEVTAKLDGKAQKATLTEYAVLPAPEFGGTVLSAGRYRTELIGRPDGQLQAFVTDEAGAKLDAGAKAKLKARLGAKADHEVDFDWSPEHNCFIGKLDKGVKLGVEPVSVALEAGGKSQLGGVALLPISVEAHPEAAVVVAGDFPVELSTNAGFVEARVFNAFGQAQADGNLDLELFAGADANQKLAFSWHAPSACYRAKLGAKLDLQAVPIRIGLFSGGRWQFGGASSLKAVHDARLNASARADADAKLTADAKLGGDAKLAGNLPNVHAKAKLGADAKAAADAKAKALADAKAKAAAKGNATAKASVSVPTPKVEVKKSATASASTDNKGSAKAGFKAGFSLGTK